MLSVKRHLFMGMSAVCPVLIDSPGARPSNIFENPVTPHVKNVVQPSSASLTGYRGVRGTVKGVM